MSKKAISVQKHQRDHTRDLHILIAAKQERPSLFGRRALRIFRSGVNDALETAAARNVKVTVKSGAGYIEGVPTKSGGELVVPAQKPKGRRR